MHLLRATFVNDPNDGQN